MSACIAALFEDGDISGKEIFGFHTPKRRNAMVNKASEMATPKSAPPKQDFKTPHHFRNQLKKSKLLGKTWTW